MIRLSWSGALLSVGVVAVLAACGSPQSASSGLVPATAQDRASSGASYLYISTEMPTIGLYSYPAGHKIADIPVSGQTFGVCGASGNVFITAVSGKHDSGRIFEFAAGSQTPTQTLKETEAAVDCSYNGGTGDLAVVNRSGSQYSNGSLSVFANAQGTPKLYSVPAYFAAVSGCAYDNAGDLFVGGAARYGSSNAFILAELAQGSSSFTQITLNKQITGTGSTYSVQWDGSQLAVTDRTSRGQGPTMVYRIAISGSTGIVQGSTKLKTHSNKNFISSPYTWIDGHGVLAPSKAGVSMWPFPKGGKGKAILKSGGAFAEVVTTSS